MIIAVSGRRGDQEDASALNHVMGRAGRLAMIYPLTAAGIMATVSESTREKVMGLQVVVLR